MNQLPALKLPSLFHENDERWATLYKDNPMFFNHDFKMSTKTTTGILLPPILTNQIDQITAVPLSPPYSTCSSLPSSPDSSLSSDSHFSSPVATTPTKKGSIQSLLNSGSELLALDQQSYFNNNNHKKRKSIQEESANLKKFKADDRQIKGLRLFSKQVCDKVAEKRTTTYNEVADELAADIQRQNQTMVGIDQKNIRRRVYDALNVLMALDLIKKDRKEIKWLGHDNTITLEEEILHEEARQKQLKDAIHQDKTSCNEAWIHLHRLKQLVHKNKQHQHLDMQHVQLPFFLIGGRNMDTRLLDIDQAYLTSTSRINIYKDIDILAELWPSPAIIT